MAWINLISGYRNVTIDRGDTLQRIALRELGDAGLWTQLVSINNLLPPYIVDTLSEVTSTRVLLAGSTIMVPSPTKTETGVADETSILGTDAQLVKGMLTDDGAGDLAVVSGMANLNQAIEHRLLTKRGELIRHPTYGNRVYELVGKMNGPVATQLAASYVAKCVNSDPRVAKTASATATKVGDKIVLSATATPVDGKALPVGATLGA